MVNLLPHDAKRALTIRYWSRLATVICILLSLAAVLAGVALAPSWFFARTLADAGERYQKAAEDSIGLKERAGAAREVAILAERVSLLDAYAKAPSLALAERAVLAARTTGVTVDSLSMNLGEEGRILVAVSGRATTRDSLLNFAASLKEVRGFSDVALPVSQLVGDKNIDFSLNATYHAP